ncbi:MAG: polysaccharide deacetylase family protein [Clostridia bacterium]|nr:polysaccharide deacetylase family protein [Clostridia bacterium]
MRKIYNKGLQIVVNSIIVLVIAVSYLLFLLPERTITISKGEDDAIYYGDKDLKRVSLMFNVYENKEVVYSILEVLKSKGVKATFFMGGCFADDNKELLVKIANDGHELANHGYFHKDHKKLSIEENKKEIFNTEQVIKSLTGVKTNLFAPPSGSFSKSTLIASKELGYKVIMWSKDTIDWRDSDQKLIFNRATKNLENGDLVLMHPKEHTLLALPKIIDFYIESGFSVVTVSENIGGV